MNIKKVIKYTLIIAVPSLLLAKCSMKEIINVLPPSLNSHPKEKLRIYGNFPFKNDVDFGLQATYVATNSICDSVSIDITRKAEREIEIKPIWKGGNNFEAEVFHDYLSSGICGWKLGAVSYTMKRKPGGIGVFGLHGKSSTDVFACISDNVSEHQNIPIECKKMSTNCSDLESAKMNKECISCNYLDDKSIRYIENEKFPASYSYHNAWCAGIPKTQKAIQLHFTDKGREE